jgi:adenylate kinase family enzyme
MISLVNILKEVTSSPKAIILAGAPGAGKSSIVGDIISSLGLKVLNIDDHFITNLKNSGVSLDLKKADSEGRSKAAMAMQQAQKSYQDELDQEIEKRGNIVIDGTAASYNKTEKLKNTLESAGYKVFMVYIYTSLENSLQKNEDRFEKSGGKDRSLMPGIVLQTWANVTKNFIPYLNLFGSNFVATTKDKGLVDAKSLDDIVKTYVEPFDPKDVKQKTPAQEKSSQKQKEKTTQDIKDLMSKEKVEQHLQHIVSNEEAQSKLKQFLQS